MIVDAIREAVLGQFPPALPLSVAAVQPAFYLRAAEARPGLTVIAIDPGARSIGPVGDANLLFDGLGDCDDPPALLRALRTDSPQLRLFALVPNGAYGPSLARFAAGERAYRSHPLVDAEIAELFAAGGWTTIARVPIVDGTPVPAAYPAVIAAGPMTLTVDSAEMSRRLRTAGFLVTAQPV